MARGEQALLNQVYPTAVHGDTVVLRPRGDAAGFTLHAVSTEMAHVRELIESGRVRNLLIDLGHHRYFGSMVIGDLIDLAQRVRGHGGRTGLCAVSDDMSSVLRLMELDDQWERFPTCSAGLHALAKIHGLERVWSKRYSVAFATVAVVILAVYWFYPRPNYALVHHDRLERLWHEVSTKRSQVGVEEWRWTAKKTQTQLTPIIAQLERKLKSHRATAGEKYLLLATKYHWLPWLAETGFDEDRDRQLTQYFLDMTHAQNTGGPAPSIPAVAATTTPQVAALVEVDGENNGSTSTSAPAEAVILPVSGAAGEASDVSPSEADGSQSTESLPQSI